MDLILKSLVPVVFVILLGLFAGWRKIIDPKVSKHLATYLINFGFPCLLFLITATANIDDIINYRLMTCLFIGLMGMYLLIFIVNHYIYHRPVSHSCQATFVSSFPNMAFMGIPIFPVLFGEQSLITIALANMVTSLFMIPITVTILDLSQNSQAKTKISTMMLKVLKEPLILAPMCGFIITVLNLQLPSLAIASLKMVSTTTSGIALFTLGLIISAEKIDFSRFMISNIFFKNLIHPLIMWGIVVVLGIEGILAKEAILLCAMPTAVVPTMFAIKYDLLKAESSSSMIVGVAISLFSAALVMYLLGIGAPV